MLIRSRYKVTHVQSAKKNYAALLAVDIEGRDKREYLLNVYEGELVKQYVGCFDQLRHCPEYRGIFMDQGSLVAVFDSVEGEPIDQVFYRGAAVDWKQRVSFADQLFHLGLCISDFPPEISCAALLSENLRIKTLEGRIVLRYQIEPLEGMNQREAALLLVDQARKILLRRFNSPDAEIVFLESLEEQVFLSPVELYRHWLQHRQAITDGYQALDAKVSLQRWLYLLFRNLVRGIRRLRKGKRRR